MIFKQWQQVLDGTKTQTRRLTQRGQRLTPDRLHTESSWPFPPTVLENARIKWMVRKTYAVQPGRGEKAVGRFRITQIRRERLQSISDKDAEAEGIHLKRIRSGDRGWSNGLDGRLYPRREQAFKYLWNSIDKKPGTRWADNPEVWVLTFEVVRRK